MNTNIADRPLSLAVHLRRAATLIDSHSVSYNWQSVESCNCGIVARMITGKSEDQMLAAIKPFMVSPSNGNNSWAKITSRSCPITGVPEHEIFRQLYDAGMRFEDFSHLERQSNPEIEKIVSEKYMQPKTVKRFLLRDKIENVPAKTKCDNRLTLVAYLNEWAELIETFHANRPTTIPTDAQLEKIELRELVKP